MTPLDEQVDSTPLTREQALAELLAIGSNNKDCEQNHSDADDVLLRLINDEEISSAYDQIKKWYA